MNQYTELLNRVTSTHHHDRMLHSVEVLRRNLGVNHFWYNKVTYSGFTGFFSTTPDWSSFCAREVDTIKCCPYLYYPSSCPAGVQLLGMSSNEKLQKILNVGRNKFKTNFNLHIVTKTAEYIEGFGFGTPYNNAETYELLIRELPSILQFIKYFRKTNQRIFSMAEECPINLKAILGSGFITSEIAPVYDRRKLLKEIGIDLPKFSARDKDILGYLANGYPVSYIADELALSKRTIESHIDKLKNKLDCHSKIDLIQKAKHIVELI